MSNQVETIIEYQLDNRDKKTVFWRGILAIPAICFIASFTELAHWGWTTGFLVVPTLLALLFTGKYPSYVLNFNHALIELQTRVFAYLFMLTDDYPTIERNPKVAVLLPDVEGGAKLGRGIQLLKFIFAIPLVIVGLFYLIGAIVVSLFAWIKTSATGTYPESVASYVLRTIQFWNRVDGYALLMVTDEYPRFTL
jgi:TRAP-type mannitol/chloroaromatic compound transport system permease small subunit